MNKHIKIILALTLFSSLEANSTTLVNQQNVNNHNNVKKNNYNKLLTGKKDVDGLIFKLIKTKEALDALDKQREQEKLEKRSKEEIEHQKEVLEQKKYDRQKRENLKKLEELENKIQMDKRKAELEQKNDLIISEKMKNMKVLVDYNLLQIKYLENKINKKEKIKINSNISFGNKIKYSIDNIEYQEKIDKLLKNKEKLDSLKNKEEQLLLLTSIVKNKVLFKSELKKLNVLSKSKNFLENEMNIDTQNNTQSIYGRSNQNTNQNDNEVLDDKEYVFVSDLDENPDIEIKQYPDFLILELKK